MILRTLHLFILMGLFLGLLIFGCGPKPIARESILDTPENHYSQGLRELDAGQLDAAAAEFQRASALDPDYPGGYVGMGLVMAEKGDFRAALESVNRGIDKNNKFIDGPITKGRIIVMQKEDDKWLDRAINQYEDALEINPESEKAIFYMGIAYKEAYEFGEAANAFSRVIAFKGDFAGAANSEWELVQKIQRAAPGTKVGASIALIPEIDRADLAVLFIEELKLLEILQKNQPQVYDTRFRPPEDPREMQTSRIEQMAAITDIDDHWAKNWIEDAVAAGAIDVFPDHTFRPDEKIMRVNYAMFLQNILVAVSGDQSIVTKYIGTPSRFPDVNNTHYAYNAICLAVDRGIMKADTINGTFGMSKPVSGADALLIIRELQNALRMTF
ncbi:S-layer homology domain-containing protein [bacterium]|nr:S-layer homology domain-containing protein [bacterium]